jgi:hypothetical protein
MIMGQRGDLRIVTSRTAIQTAFLTLDSTLFLNMWVVSESAHAGVDRVESRVTLAPRYFPSSEVRTI